MKNVSYRSSVFHCISIHSCIIYVTCNSGEIMLNYPSASANIDPNIFKISYQYITIYLTDYNRKTESGQAM